MENCDVDVLYGCKYLDVDELNDNAEIFGVSHHVSCLSLNCRNISASNHFELIDQFLSSFSWTFDIDVLIETLMTNAESQL